jgi:hypothetical protein
MSLCAAKTASIGAASIIANRTWTAMGRPVVRWKIAEESCTRTKMPNWWLTTDGDRACLEMYERHYSCYEYKDARIRKLFVGPGEKVVLRTWRGDAFFVWRKFIDDSGQVGVNCAAFRNESGILSSRLIREAEAVAGCLWPNMRRYTYVDSEAVRSGLPGNCFLLAGWKYVRKGRHRLKTGSGKLILVSRNA